MSMDTHAITKIMYQVKSQSPLNLEQSKSFTAFPHSGVPQSHFKRMWQLYEN